MRSPKSAMIDDSYAPEFCLRIEQAGFALRRWVIWVESFGQHRQDNLSCLNRHLFYALKDPKRFVFHADAVRVPIARQVVYDDPRPTRAAR